MALYGASSPETWVWLYMTSLNPNIQGLSIAMSSRVSRRAVFLSSSSSPSPMRAISFLGKRIGADLKNVGCSTARVNTFPARLPVMKLWNVFPSFHPCKRLGRFSRNNELMEYSATVLTIYLNTNHREAVQINIDQTETSLPADWQSFVSPDRCCWSRCQ